MNTTKLRMKMLVGLPCAGKSTFIQSLDNDDRVILSTDDYIQRMAEIEGSTYGEVFDKYIKDAMKNLHTKRNNAIKDRRDIIWDQTNLTVKSRSKKLNLIPNNIYYREAIVFNVPEGVLLERLEKRYKEEGKFIPFHVFERMKDSFVFPTLDEGFDKITIIKGD